MANGWLHTKNRTAVWMGLRKTDGINRVKAIFTVIRLFFTSVLPRLPVVGISTVNYVWYPDKSDPIAV